MKEFWDKRYSESDYVYGTEPNVFFARELQKLSPGTLLLPAEGEGRNALHAARLGWQVFAFDQSSAGKEKAEKLAKNHNVSITYQIADADSITYPENHFDLIALIYVHLPGETRHKLHRKCQQWLRPGGIVLLEAFSKDQHHNTSGGPRDMDLLYSADSLADDFPDLDIYFNLEMQADLCEGTYHQGKADIVRFLAKKKA